MNEVKRLVERFHSRKEFGDPVNIGGIYYANSTSEGRQFNSAYQCLPDTVDPRGPKGAK